MNTIVERPTCNSNRNILNDIFGVPSNPVSQCSNICDGLIQSKIDTRQPDALQAVKMDPAVLEAQVTIDTSHSEKTNVSSYQQDRAELKTSEHKKASEVKSGFEKAVSMQEAALLSLSPQQFQLLLKYVDTLRRQRLTFQKQMECAFCKNNGQPETWYTTHALKDGKGRVRCPVLRAFSCRRCGATGDDAHTIRYCPENNSNF